MKRLRTWFRANYLYYRLWRVTYPDGQRTRLLFKDEAYNMQEVFGGRLWIDYDADISIEEKYSNGTQSDSN